MIGIDDAPVPPNGNGNDDDNELGSYYAPIESTNNNVEKNMHANSKKTDRFDSDYEKLMSERGKLMKGPPIQ